MRVARADRVLCTRGGLLAEMLERPTAGCGATAAPLLRDHGDAKPLGAAQPQAGAGPLGDELRQAECGAGARLVWVRVRVRVRVGVRVRVSVRVMVRVRVRVRVRIEARIRVTP